MKFKNFRSYLIKSYIISMYGGFRADGSTIET